MPIVHKYAYTYLSDDGNNYAVVLNTSQAAFGGFTAATAGLGWLPNRYKMRTVHVVAPSGRRHTFPAHSPGFTPFVDPAGVSISYDGETFTGTGSSGERRTLTQSAP